MSIYMCIYIYIHIHVRVDMYIYVCVYTHVHICKHAYTSTCRRMCMHILHIYIHVSRMYAYVLKGGNPEKAGHLFKSKAITSSPSSCGFSIGDIALPEGPARVPGQHRIRVQEPYGMCVHIHIYIDRVLHIICLFGDLFPQWHSNWTLWVCGPQL